jgi:putative CocE/NonD family hydrolase
MRQAATAAMILERDQIVRTVDGVALRADVYRPDVAHRVPCVLTRTPYDKSRAVTVVAGLDPEQAVAAGLAVVCQDVRGRFASEGRFEPFRHEASDGRASVDWVANQPWCSGRGGMAGRSYAAATQWLAASTGASPLRAICPIVGASDPYSGAAYQGGAFQLGANLFWAHLIMSASRSRSEVRRAYQEQPQQELELFHGTAADFYYDWLAHPERDDYWAGVGLKNGRPDTPLAVLNIGGWFDPFLGGTLANFASRNGRLADQRLLVGPWGHGGAWGSYPDHRLPDMPGSDIDLDAIVLDFFRERLIEAEDLTEPEELTDPEQLTEPEQFTRDVGLVTREVDDPVRLYVMGGAGEWLGASAWPPPNVSPQPWYLRRDGELAPEPPDEGEEPDCYHYDPADPTPTVGGPLMMPAGVLGSHFGPVDRASLETRPDVLVYTSAACAEPLRIVGPVEAVLFAATTAPDTDYVVALSVVDEWGVSRILAEGIRRVRYRFGFDSAVPATPGEVMRLQVDLVATSTLVRAGQRIRVTVSSSSFPRFDRNLNTGGRLGTESLEHARIAQQSVRHDARYPSQIRLPILSGAEVGLS